jgi:hypothetical protein
MLSGRPQSDLLQHPKTCIMFPWYLSRANDTRRTQVKEYIRQTLRERGITRMLWMYLL